MASQNVIDELIVKLTLDAKDYKASAKQIDALIAAVEKRAQQTDAKKKRRDIEQKKRNQETLKSVKELGLGIKSLALTIGTMIGVGSAAGLVGAVVALAGMETNLRRAAVSTGMSNRQMQAWGSTARRLGADAQAGAAAIADLAREQSQFNITGNAPTMQAFARMGVRTGPNASIVDMLAQAQQTYRQAAPAQKQQIEAGLSAQGVSPDLIVAIKSEKDVREEFARSYKESSEENRKGLDAVSNALASLENAATTAANTILSAFQPQIDDFSNWLSDGVQNLTDFSNQVIDAGGGVQGFMKVLDKESPELAGHLRDINSGFTLFAQSVDLATYGLKLIWQGLESLYDWIDNKLSFLTGGKGDTHPLKDAVGTVGKAIAWAWKGALSDASIDGVTHLSDASQRAGLTPSAAARVRAGELKSTPLPPAVADVSNGKDFMARLISRYNLTVPQAAAIAANAQRESGFNTGAFNAAGGGTGARGLFQWRGARTAAFRKQYGYTPDQAPLDEQIDFMMQNPYERHLLMKSLNGPGGAGDLGANFSRIFEGHGNVQEDARRGQVASQLASAYGGTNGGAGIGQQVNIQSMTVQANNPQELSTGLTRISSPQNYNSAVR